MGLIIGVPPDSLVQPDRLVPMASKHKNIVHDRWLSQVLQRDVYQLLVDDDLIKKVRNEASREYELLTELQSGCVFFYARVSPDALAAVKFLESRGFNLIDTNVTLSRPIAPTHDFISSCTVRFAAPEDQNQVIWLARKSFVYSRFHLDTAFPRKIANMLKAEWVKNYFTGNRGNAMVVALIDEIIAGFLLLIYGKDRSLVIDLLAVNENHRRKGVAKDMITCAESQCQGFTRISVGTQLANLPSLRLYEGMGFSVEGAQYTFHYHHE